MEITSNSEAYAYLWEASRKEKSVWFQILQSFADQIQPGTGKRLIQRSDLLVRLMSNEAEIFAVAVNETSLLVIMNGSVILGE